MDTGGGRSKTIYVKEVFAFRFSVLSFCVKAVRCTPTTEYMMRSRPCAFISRVVFAQKSHLQILLKILIKYLLPSEQN